jgi:type II secretory pathway pseudopilin PulG
MKLNEAIKQVVLGEGKIPSEIRNLFKAITTLPQYKQNKDKAICTLDEGGYGEITIKDANEEMSDSEGLSNMEITYGFNGDKSGKFSVESTGQDYKSIKQKVDMDKAIQLAKRHIINLATA